MTQQHSASSNAIKLAIVLALTFIAALLIWLVYDVLRPSSSPCEAIYQQSEMQLGVKLSFLESNGEVVLGRQPIEKLSAQAQEMAINLKACCVIHSGETDGQGFGKCSAGYQAFSTKVAAIEAQVNRAAEASATGAKEAEEEATTRARQLLAEADDLAQVFEQQISGLTAPVLESKDGIYFYDDFSSEKLKPEWRIRQPDADRWMLQAPASTLLVVTQKGSQLEVANDLRNQFILNHTLPENNFIMETRIDIAIQHQKNGGSMGIWVDQDNYLEIGYYGFPHGYNVRRSPFFRKEVRGQANTNEANRGQHGSVKQPEVVYLRITRDGHKYVGAYAMPEGTAKPSAEDWHIIATHAIPDFKGKASLWASNQDGKVYSTTMSVSPEIPVEFSYLKIVEAEDE